MCAQDRLDLNPQAERQRVRDIEQALDRYGEPDKARAEAEEEAQQAGVRVAPPDAKDEREDRGAHYEMRDVEVSCRGSEWPQEVRERTEESPADEAEDWGDAFLIAEVADEGVHQDDAPTEAVELEARCQATWRR